MADEKDGFRRLGKRELGSYAFEKQWPKRVGTIVEEEGAENDVKDVVPKLAKLLKDDLAVDSAYLCCDSVTQVYKVSGEGHHFCGYRNLQMLMLSLAPLQGLGSRVGCLQQKQTVSQLQDMIESAWDAGVNAHGKVLTGGIKGTRKHIGTSEAEAVLLSLEIPCTGTAFHGQDACRELFDSVEAYFANSVASNSRAGVHVTSRLPIFLQRPRHSITIIGIERTKAGARRLLTFDPAYRPPSAIRKKGMPETKSSKWAAQRILWRYRKAESGLKRYNMFETLSVGNLE